MPWLETDTVTERKRFALEAAGALFSFTELCRRHGISNLSVADAVNDTSVLPMSNQ